MLILSAKGLQISHRLEEHGKLGFPTRVRLPHPGLVIQPFPINCLTERLSLITGVILLLTKAEITLGIP